MVPAVAASANLGALLRPGRYAGRAASFSRPEWPGDRHGLTARRARRGGSAGPAAKVRGHEGLWGRRAGTCGRGAGAARSRPWR